MFLKMLKMLKTGGIARGKFKIDFSGIGCKFGHQMAPLALVANLVHASFTIENWVTKWLHLHACIGLQLAPLALVPKCILVVLSPKCERIKEMGSTISFDISG